MDTVHEEVLDMLAKDIGIPKHILREILKLDEELEKRKTTIVKDDLTYSDEEKKSKSDEITVHAVTLHVDCEKNPEYPVADENNPNSYVGFDFTVEIKDADEIIEMIKETCEKYNRPIIRIREGYEKPAQRKDTHTRTDIKKAIKQGY